MNKILVAEDDKAINSLLCEFLSEQGYEMLSSENGLDALRLITETPDLSLVILDLMLPYKSGDMVLAAVRENSDLPVIVVSAKSDTRSKIDMIRLGADDYMTKPFDLDELAVRVEAVLRRCSKQSAEEHGERLTYHALELDTESGSAYVNGSQLVLTSKEFAILELLLRNPNKLFSKSNLFESVWHEAYLSDDNAVKVHISNIRTKLKKYDPEHEYIETVWGMGYKLS